MSSPQWFEPYTYNSENPLNGNPSNPKVNLNFPLTASLGLAYRGFDKMLIASDFRYLDYRNTNGFRRGGFGPGGVLEGLGWQSIFAYALGIQYQWTDSFSTRIGYTFSMNPVGPAMTTYNLGSPTIIMNSLAIGCSYNLTQAFKILNRIRSRLPEHHQRPARRTIPRADPGRQGPHVHHRGHGLRRCHGRILKVFRGRSVFTAARGSAGS